MRHTLALLSRHTKHVPYQPSIADIKAIAKDVFNGDSASILNTLNSSSRILIPYTSRIYIPGRQSFVATYSPVYHLGLLGQQILERPHHPLFLPTLERFRKRSRTGIWWQAAAGLTVSKKRVVRSWVTDRLRNAFGAALVGRGWDYNGLRWLPYVPVERMRKWEGQGLFGTVTMLAVKEAMEKSDDEMIVDATLLVQGLEKEMERWSESEKMKETDWVDRRYLESVERSRLF